MSEFIVTVANNGFIVEEDGTKVVFEQKFKDDIPQSLFVNLLSEFIGEVEHRDCTEFKVKVDVEPYEPRLALQDSNDTGEDIR